MWSAEQVEIRRFSALKWDTNVPDCLLLFFAGYVSDPLPDCLLLFFAGYVSDPLSTLRITIPLEERREALKASPESRIGNSWHRLTH